MPMQCTPVQPHRATRATRMSRAFSLFSLMELLVVILIIALVMAILLPAVSGARKAAKNVASLAMLNSLSVAAGAFATDKQGQRPGYFSPADMGHFDNADRGFSAMQNIMLDLAGGVTTAAANGGTILRVGPRTAVVANVDIAQIGSSSTAGTARAYFNPDGNFYDIDPSRRSIGQVASEAAHRALPSLVDAFGTPILAWSEDERKGTRFAAADSSGPDPARFYWTPNACFLKSDALGARATNQRFQVIGSAYSMLGLGIGSTAIEGTMEALLGNPSEPAKDYNAVTNPKANAPRAPLVFHSAGADGYFLGSLENGGKAAGGTGPVKYSRDIDAVRPPFFDDVIVGTGK